MWRKFLKTRKYEFGEDVKWLNLFFKVWSGIIVLENKFVIIIKIEYVDTYSPLKHTPGTFFNQKMYKNDHSQLIQSWKILKAV